ncbi:MAG: hypothetical protein AABX16_00645 [Nanoarchaeota archaeon]
MEDTVKRVYESGFIGIAEHALCEAHGGMGKENLERLLPYMHAIEGHNSQLIFNYLTLLPKIGKEFTKYSKKLNKEAQLFADQHDKSWIATSDGHRIEDAGISSIECEESLLARRSEEHMIGSIGNIITSKNFAHNCHYQDLKGWFDWTLKLKFGYKKVTGESQ